MKQESDERFKKENENLDNDLNHPQMIIREKNCEIIKKAIDIFFEEIEILVTDMPRELIWVFKEFFKSFKMKEKIFKKVFIDFCVLKRLENEFGKKLKGKKGKKMLSSFLNVIKIIFEDEKTDEISEFENFLPAKRSKTKEIFLKFEKETEKMQEDEENSETIFIEAYCINIENIDKLVNLFVENRQSFLGNNQRALNNATL